MTIALSPNPSTGRSVASDRALRRRLRRTWRLERLHAHLLGLCWLVMAAIALLLAAWLIDWLLRLPAAGRAVLLAACAMMLGYVAWRHWWRTLRRFDPLRLSLQIERENPQLQSLLTSWVQFEHFEATPSVSARLIEATRQRAVEATRDMNFAAIVRFADVRAPAVRAIGCAVVLLGAGLLWPAHLQAFAERLVMPWRDAVYPKRVAITASSGDLLVPRGHEVLLSAAAVGTRHDLAPANGRLLVRAEGGDWQTIMVPRNFTTAYEHVLSAEQVRDSFDYQFKIGDDQTDTFRVTVVDPPVLESSTLALSFPEYMQRADQTRSQLNVEAPAGTRLRWRLRFERPIANAMLMVESDRSPEPRPVGMALSPDGRSAEAEIIAGGSFTYHLRTRVPDADGGFTFDDPVSHHVMVAPDRPPNITLLEPTRDMPATVKKQLDLTFRAEDDFALRHLYVGYQHNDTPPRRQRLTTFDRRQVENTVTWSPARSIDHLAPGDVVTVWLEVTDNLPEPAPGPEPTADNETSHNEKVVRISSPTETELIPAWPQVAATRRIDLQILTESAYRAAIADLLDEPFREIRQTHDQSQQTYSELGAFEDVYAEQKDRQPDTDDGPPE